MVISNAVGRPHPLVLQNFRPCAGHGSAKATKHLSRGLWLPAANFLATEPWWCPLHRARSGPRFHCSPAALGPCAPWHTGRLQAWWRKSCISAWQKCATALTGRLRHCVGGFRCDFGSALACARHGPHQLGVLLKSAGCPPGAHLAAFLAAQAAPLGANSKNRCFPPPVGSQGCADTKPPKCPAFPQLCVPPPRPVSIPLVRAPAAFN